MWTFAVKFVFAKYGEKFLNGQKIRRRCEVGFCRVDSPHSIVRGSLRKTLSPSLEPVSELFQLQWSYLNQADRQRSYTYCEKNA